MKRLARALLPSGAYDALAAGWDRLRPLHPERLRRRRQFGRLQRGLGAEQLALRPGLVVGVDPRSREAFEFFCFRSLDMARELDAFVEATPRHHRLLDVGALYGVFSLAFTAGRREAEALAVDPSPDAQEVLRANLARNPGCQVTAVATALGAETGSVAMRRDWHHLEALGAGEPRSEAVTVAVQSLDELCQARGFEPDLIKIDVEGYERQVLAGATQTLARFRPTIFLELHPERLQALGSSTREVAELLRRQGYRLDPVGGAGLEAALAAGRVFRLVAR